jgi:hypothetical protein
LADKSIKLKRQNDDVPQFAGVQQLAIGLRVVHTGRSDLGPANQLVARIGVGIYLVAVEALAVLLGSVRVAVSVPHPLGTTALRLAVFVARFTLVPVRLGDGGLHDAGIHDLPTAGM